MSLSQLIGRWVDTWGETHPFKNYGESPSVVATPYLYQISEGNVPHHSTWNKYGYNASVDSAAPEDIWDYGGSFAFSPSPQQMEVVSSNANDTSAGTGVQQVKIYYLDTNYEERTEVVTLNGTNAVATVATNIYRINHFVAYSVGSGKVAAGNIDIREVDDSPIYARIATGNTRSRTASYTVPVRKTLYISSARFSSTGSAANKAVTFTVRASYDTFSNSVIDFMMPIIEIGLMDSAIVIPFEMPIRLPGKTDLRVIGTSQANTTICTSGLRGWLEDE